MLHWRVLSIFNQVFSVKHQFGHVVFLNKLYVFQGYTDSIYNIATSLEWPSYHERVWKIEFEITRNRSYSISFWQDIPITQWIDCIYGRKAGIRSKMIAVAISAELDDKFPISPFFLIIYLIDYYYWNAYMTISKRIASNRHKFWWI